MCKGSCRTLYLAAIWIFLLTLPLAAEQMKTPEYLPRTQEKLTLQERWVLERLALGEKADLKKFIETSQKKEGNNILRAKFLEALLTNDFPQYKIHWHGVNIRNAYISGRLDLEGGEIPFEVKLLRCVFFDDVSLKDCRFKRSLQIIDSVFTKDAYCIRVEVDRNAYFNNSLFWKAVNFNWGRIGKELSLLKTSFHDGHRAEFEGIEIGTNVIAFYASFEGGINFKRAVVGGNMEFTSAIFSKPSFFSDIRVKGELILRKTVFREGGYFSGAEVGKGFYAQDMMFTSIDRFASFPEMRIGHQVIMRDARFSGPVDWNGAQFGQILQADNAIFERDLHANGLVVKDTASLQGTVFEGPVGLADADIGGQINVFQAKFKNEKGVEAPGLKVGQLAKATDAVFAGPLNLKGAKIGGELRADIEQGTVFEGGVFLQEVTLSDAQLSDLIIRGAPVTSLEIKKITMDRVVVNRDFILQDIVIGDLLARRAVVRGKTEFNNVIITGTIELQDSNFLALKFSQVSWPEEAKKINLSGLTYQTITGESEKKILHWLDQAVFDTRNYTAYQAYLERINRGDWADEVFINMKRREWGVQTWKNWLNPVNWPILLLWDLPVGYGRKPQNIFWFALPFIILGAILLDPRHLEGISWPQKNKLYNVAGRLLLSVDKFTPKLMEFGLDDRWRPSELSGFMQFFLHTFRLMGKVFLSIFFIAIFARFK
jgi:uncharacterized protein YjbI with pentapeptide repeats